MHDPELLKQALGILDRLDSMSRASTPLTQRRSSPRDLFRHTLTLRRHEGGKWIETLALSRDLSPGGLACLHQGPLDLGMIVTVPLPLPDGSCDVLEAQVRRQQRVDEGWFLLGLAFAQPINIQRYF